MAPHLIVRCIATFLCMQVAIVASSTDADGHGESECQAGPVKTGAALLQVKHRVGATPVLEVQRLHQGEYTTALEQNNTQKIASIIQHVVEKLGGVVVNEDQLLSFASGRGQNQAVGEDSLAQSFDVMLQEIRNVGRTDVGWLRLPPPEQGPMLWKLIRADPWNCELIVMGDARSQTCQLLEDNPVLDPETMNCSHTGNCNAEHGNAYRTLQKIGVLPCCPTPPFCAAPACTGAAQAAPSTPSTCTKRSPQENLAYMKDPDVWPAYHGWGGAMELDLLKIIDVLGCHGNNCTEKPFDLMLDLGANTGYYTEKLTVRKFAKNYIMIEANPSTSGILQARWGNQTFKEAWFTQQVADGEAPDFEIINQALSNHSKGVVDMCQTEPSFRNPAANCNVSIASVDRLVPGKLTPEFKEHFHLAQSAFIKIDTEGMDELVLRGMKRMLNEHRGQYEDGSPRFLVNFLQFEMSPWLMSLAKTREGFQQYDIKSTTQFLESVGFETFLIGPRFLPLSHGSWDDDLQKFLDDPKNNAGVRINYPKFDDRLCAVCNSLEKESFCGDIFAIRASHPRIDELKIALGACQESMDFDMKDPQYSFVQPEGSA